MVSSRLKRRMALRRRLHVRRTLTCSNTVKKRSRILDALLCVYKLKLQLEAVKKELSDLTAIQKKHSGLIKFGKEVKVEQLGKGFLVKVKCEKGGDNKLVSILEAFEEIGIDVLHAKVTCNLNFAMEAIVVVAQEQREDHRDVENLAHALTKAIERQDREGTDHRSN